jgi:serine/threonine protein kinase
VAGPPEHQPSKALLSDGRLAFLKLIWPGDGRYFLTELDRYRSIRDAPLDQSLRISRLLGLVRNKTGQVSGLLLFYIDCGCGWRTLHCAAKPIIPKQLKQKRAQQVQHIFHQLHANSIVWGDAKPDSVLIDHRNDAWVIDFGGGYTEGWVPRDLAESVEGGLQSLKKMEEFLEVWSMFYLLLVRSRAPVDASQQI